MPKGEEKSERVITIFVWCVPQRKKEILNRILHPPPFTTLLSDHEGKFLQLISEHWEKNNETRTLFKKFVLPFIKTKRNHHEYTDIVIPQLILFSLPSPDPPLLYQEDSKEILQPRTILLLHSRICLYIWTGSHGVGIFSSRTKCHLDCGNCLSLCRRILVLFGNWKYWPLPFQGGQKEEEGRDGKNESKTVRCLPHLGSIICQDKWCLPHWLTDQKQLSGQSLVTKRGKNNQIEHLTSSFSRLSERAWLIYLIDYFLLVNIWDTLSLSPSHDYYHSLPIIIVHHHLPSPSNCT